MNIIRDLYDALFNCYGFQGWWPVSACSAAPDGYHPGDYGYPHDEKERFEICVGAVLTQSTAWRNVRSALSNLAVRGWLGPEKLVSVPAEDVAGAIRPALYFNQKTKKLLGFARFFTALKGRTPEREELLNLWGIGPETADSILLYAYGVPEFVVDAYTVRILNALGLTGEKAGYDDIRALFTGSLDREVPLYQEYHALLVAHGKEHYSRKPYGSADEIVSRLRTEQSHTV